MCLGRYSILKFQISILKFQIVILSSVARTLGLLGCASLNLARRTPGLRYRNSSFSIPISDLKFAIRNLIAFPVVVSRGSHPFPSRTRKLSLLEPMVLRGQLRGRVGSRRDY